MSIDEFLDGLPSFNERNFSRFISKSSEKFPAFITTEEPYIPDEQIIVNVCTMFAPLPFLNIQWDRKRRAWTEPTGQHRKSLRVDNTDLYPTVFTTGEGGPSFSDL